MKKIFCSALLVPAILGAGTLAEDLTVYINADTKAPAGVRIPSTTRLVPGKFGKGFLIERRTRNEFKADDVILSDGATLKGKNNLLTLPAGGTAALPLTTLKPGSYSTISFGYKGAGKISVSINRKEIKSFEAKAERQYGVAVFKADGDTATVRISSDKGAVLDEVLFDRGINYANSYHAPGPIRSCDWITLTPAKHYNARQGAFSCWIKAPWLIPGFKELTGAGLFCLLWDEKPGKRFSDNIHRSITFWNTGYCDTFFGIKGTNGGASCQFKELKTFPADGWHHVVFNWKVVNGQLHASIIANGSQTFTRTSKFELRPDPVVMTVGYTGGAYVNGVLDDIAFFRRPLTLEECGKIFNSGKPLAELMK